MSENGREPLDLRTATGEEMAQAMSRGAYEALGESKRAGHPIVIWDREHDRIIDVPSEEIVVPDAAAEAAAAGDREGARG